MKKISVYVATHKNFDMPNSKVFKPVLVGSSKKDIKCNFIKDNLGDNISTKNHQYCELTATYWAYKNDLTSDYLGVCHYRRYPYFKTFFENKIFSKSKYLTKRLLFNSLPDGEFQLSREYNVESISSKRLDSIENKIFKKALFYEIIVPKPTLFSTNSVRTFFNKVLTNYSLEILIKSVNKIDHELHTHLTEMLEKNIIYKANMVLMDRTNYNNYCSILFSIMKMFEKLLENDKVSLPPRSIGYAGELITSAYILKSISNRKKILFTDILFINGL